MLEINIFVNIPHRRGVFFRSVPTVGYVCRCDAHWQDLYLDLGRKAAPGARGRDGPRTRGGSGTAGNSEQPGAVVAFAQQRRYRHGP